MINTAMSTFRVGTSGWQYNHWKGIFYPDDIGRKGWFDHYADKFDAVEVNSTFYHLPRASTLRSWGDAAQRIRDHLESGLDVHAYFNNDAYGHAVFNALDLHRYVMGD